MHDVLEANKLQDDIPTLLGLNTVQDPPHEVACNHSKARSKDVVCLRKIYRNLGGKLFEEITAEKY
ncbi:MAG: hypothetical protein QXK88_07630 [Desulfurococcaceae archaeon]